MAPPEDNGMAPAPPPSMSVEEQIAALTATVQQQQDTINQFQADGRRSLPDPDELFRYDDEYSGQSPGGQLNNMLGNILPSTSNSGDNEESPDFLDALVDVEKPITFGPAINSHIAESYNVTMTRQLSKETGEKLKQSLQIPENCKIFQVPKMNPEIWQSLSAKARVGDLKHQSIQNTLSSGMTALAQISHEVAENAGQLPKDFVTKIIKIALDGANLLGTQTQEITKKRRLEVKPFLSPDYVGICNAQIPASDLLFGPNLTETMKSSKAASLIIRNTSYGKHRFTPFRLNQRPQNLNFMRPGQSFRGRWNGQNQFQNQNQIRFQPRTPNTGVGFRPRFPTTMLPHRR